MKTITIKKQTIVNYLNEGNYNEREKIICEQICSLNQDEISIEIDVLSDELMEYILINDGDLDLQTKTDIAIEKLKSKSSKNNKIPNDLWNTKIKSLDDIIQVYTFLKKEKYNIDFFVFNRLYPAKINFTLHNASKYHPKYVELILNFKIYKNDFNFDYKIEFKTLLFIKGENKILTFKDLMLKFNVFEQKENIALHEDKLKKCNELQLKDGKQICCNGFGLTDDFKILNMDSYNLQSSGIIESKLELVEDRRNYLRESNEYTQLPFVRIFSLMYKRYIYLHIDDIFEYQYNKKAFEKLFLPTKMKSILHKVFSYSISQLSNDLINNKHGGLIIMAEGNPGTGKTSTAEVYSELMEKPLYNIQVFEIGTNPSEIETNLTKIFARIEKWGAVILFDEVDVFLSKRNHDIQKSAIVGIFLRLMDYFRGMMFLTTNRSAVIDDAILSRITLTIKYPDFDDYTRNLIWKSKLNDAGIKINSTNQLMKENLNGRQIRNMVRLSKIVFGDKTTENELIELIHNSISNLSNQNI